MRLSLMVGVSGKRVKPQLRRYQCQPFTFVKSVGAGGVSGDKAWGNRLLWPPMSSVQTPAAPAFDGSARAVAPDTIQLTGVRKCYDEFVAVDNLTLTIEPGGIYGLLGPNGAGKTSTIRMLMGITVPDVG